MLRGLIPYLAYAYVSFVGLTTRIRLEGTDHRAALRARGQHFIYAFWHERQVFLTYTHRDQNATVMVSRSRDGDLIAETMRLSRMGACRGSSSRGGQAATRELLAAAESGMDLAMTPDGPKGPSHEVKNGVLFLAQKTGLPILPLTNALSRKVVFHKSWDRFQLPLPFGRAVLRYAAPITVGPEDDLAAKAAELKRVLDEITSQAEAQV